MINREEIIKSINETSIVDTGNISLQMGIFLIISAFKKMEVADRFIALEKNNQGINPDKMKIAYGTPSN